MSLWTASNLATANCDNPEESQESLTDDSLVGEASPSQSLDWKKCAPTHSHLKRNDRNFFAHGNRVGSLVRLG